MSAPRWQDARRILCVRLDSLGDVLMCTPALRALRAAVPGRTLTLLGAPAGTAALPFVPELDDAIVCQAPWMKDAGAQPRIAVAALAEALAARRFDAAVIFTSATQSALPAALLCHQAGIPLRLAHCRENPYGLLSDWVPDPESAMPVRHEVVRQLALVRHVGCAAAGLGLSFAVRRADVATVRRRLRAAGIDADAPWLLLHPGASAASRRYPPGLWAQVLRLLAEECALPLVLTGSAAETALIDDIRAAAGMPMADTPAAGATAAGVPVAGTPAAGTPVAGTPAGSVPAAGVPAVSLAGQLTLGELGAALHLATLALTNNTGPAHIAAAVGTPTVDLYALTNPQHTPWKVRNRVLFHDVPCRFCFKSNCPAGHHACLAGVAPARVVEAVRSLLAPPREPVHGAGAGAGDVMLRIDADSG